MPQVDGRVERIPKQRAELALVHLANDSESRYMAKMNDYSDNDAAKREGQSAGMLKLVFSPLVRFFKSYVLKGGFRLGKLGFVISCNDAIYKFLVLAKMAEREAIKKNSK